MEIPVGVVPPSVVDERVDPSCIVLCDASELAGTTDFIHTSSYVPGRLLRRRARDVVAIRHDAIISDRATTCKASAWTPRSACRSLHPHWTRRARRLAGCGRSAL